MVNALYRVETTSPNGQVRHAVMVAAVSETEAREYLLSHEMWGRDGYQIGTAALVGDLDEARAEKNARRPSIIRVEAAL